MNLNRAVTAAAIVKVGVTLLAVGAVIGTRALLRDPVHAESA